MSELKTMAELRGMIAEARANHKPDKKVMGRPTKYCPEFCEIVIELG